MSYGELTIRLDFEQLDSVSAHDISPVKLSDGYVAFFYQEGSLTSPTGYLKTYPIDINGNIGSMIDSWSLGSPNFWQSRDSGTLWSFKVKNDIYIMFIIWNRPTPPYDNYLIARTFQISDTGIITKSYIASANCGNGTARTITGASRKAETNTFAVVQLDSTTQGILRTFTCNNDGTNLVYADSWAWCSGQDFIPVRCQFTGGNILALTYQISTTTYLKTCEVADDGTITKSFLDTENISNRINAYLCLIEDTMLAVFSDSGYCNTYTVTTGGGIVAADTTQYKTGVTFNLPRVTNIGTDGSKWYFIISYRRGSYDGYIISLPIEPDGTIGSIITEVNMQNINTCMHTYPPAVANTDIFALTWNVNSSSGQIDTYGVKEPAVGGEGYSVLIFN